MGLFAVEAARGWLRDGAASMGRRCLSTRSSRWPRSFPGDLDRRHRHRSDTASDLLMTQLPG